MLNKSSEQILDNNLTHIQKEFERNIPSLVLCSEPFHKVEFLNLLINSVNNPILFIDMDLLYTGYVKSGMIQGKNNVTIYHPDKISWEEMLLDIIMKVSENKSLIVIDSFNGIYNMFNALELTRFVNSCIMLLASIGKQTSCTIVVTAMVRKNDNDEWVLSPGGKQIIKSEETGVYFLKKIKNSLVINTVKETDPDLKIFTIVQKNN